MGVIFRMSRFMAFLVVLPLFVVNGCGGGSSGGGASKIDNPKFFFGTMTAMDVDIAYETGADPFASNKWTMLKLNLEALFRDRPIKPTVTLPTSSDQMTNIPSQGKTAWTLYDILDLEMTYRSRKSDGATGRFWVVFLKGYLEKDGAPNTAVIGVSITGTTVIAMFKDVIESTGVRATGQVPRFVEQSTIVHEIGHALGLVANGVTLQSSHHDAANGAHCRNPNCVMYYQNEGKDSLQRFREQLRDTEDPVIFGAECLEDAKLFKP